jgi:hypothetical protein
LRSLLPAYRRSCVGDGAADWAGHLHGRRRLAERRPVARAARRTGLLATAGRHGELGQGGARGLREPPRRQRPRGREPRARRQAAPRQPTANAEAAARRTVLLATAGRRGELGQGGAAVCESRPGARGREGASCKRDGRRHRGSRQQMQRRRRDSRGVGATSPRLGFTFTTSRAGLCLCSCAGSRLF